MRILSALIWNSGTIDLGENDNSNSTRKSKGNSDTISVIALVFSFGENKGIFEQLFQYRKEDVTGSSTNLVCLILGVFLSRLKNKFDFLSVQPLFPAIEINTFIKKNTLLQNTGVIEKYEIYITLYV